MEFEWVSWESHPLPQQGIQRSWSTKKLYPSTYLLGGPDTRKGYQHGEAPLLQRLQDGLFAKCGDPLKPAGAQAGRKDLRSQHSRGRSIGVELQEGASRLGTWLITGLIKETGLLALERSKSAVHSGLK
jgi:hypothetical protein